MVHFQIVPELDGSFPWLGTIVKSFIYSKLFTQKKKKVKNIDQCPTIYILDLNMGNLKVKIIIKEKKPNLK